MIIGLTGNSGTGKSEVARMVSEKAYIIDADKIGHDVLNDNVCKNEVIAFFGDCIVDDGVINRKKLGDIVFNDAYKLNVLTEITHRYIVEIVKNEIEKNKDKTNIVLDAPLLVESNLHKMCDCVVVVVSTMENKINRIMKRDNKTKKQAEDRLNKQTKQNELEKYADYIIENNTDIESLHSEVCRVFGELL